MSRLERLEARRAVLIARGIASARVDALLGTTGSPDGLEFPGAWPEEEPMAGDWGECLARAEGQDVWTMLSGAYVPLRFPVRDGMSRCPEYVQSRQSGKVVLPEDACEPEAVPGLSLVLLPTMAGRLPVLEVPERAAFEGILQALCHRNEPVPVPASQGAALIGGLVNHRRAAKHRVPGVPLAKPLYQDCLVVVCRGPYSALPAPVLGYPDADSWIEASSLLRRAHESAHYLSRRIFGAMRRAVFDEFAADAYALMALDGLPLAQSLGTLLGIDAPDGGGRILNYLDAPDQATLRAVCGLVRDAAPVLERLASQAVACSAGDPVAARGRMLAALYPLSLEELLLPGIDARWAAALAALPMSTPEAP